MWHIGYPLFENVLSLKELETLKVNSIPTRGFENKVYKLDLKCVCEKVPKRNSFLKGMESD